MTSTNNEQRSNTQPEEWLSILLAVFATIGATLFIGYYPHYTPKEAGVIWAIPVWIGFIYLILQMSFLLFSTSRVGALGVLDSILSIIPVVAGLVVLVQTIISKEFSLSTFQFNTLAVLIVAGASEFLLTIWARFVINRRTIGWGGSN